MTKNFVAGVVMCALMLLSAALARVAVPTTRMAAIRPAIELGTAIPVRFGDWEEDLRQAANVVNPTTEAALHEIYAQTLSRTYVNKNGAQIMLSIAYGTEQSDNLSVHFPEGCYVGQGFAVGPTEMKPVATPYGSLPTAQLVASMYSRNEPITYWVVVGDHVVTTSWQLKKAKLAYSFQGIIPDATLMRVSNVTPDTAEGYQVQRQFIADLLAALTPEQRHHFAGL
ncbi:MAG: exosortase-associated protein EpsI, B-type [Pseudomonadota bacterium]